MLHCTGSRTLAKVCRVTAGVGPTVIRADRLLAVAHVGQVLVFAAVVDLLGSALPSPLGLRSLGPHRLFEQGRAEEIHQLVPAWTADRFSSASKP